jgi:deoxycytidylate deaminase
MCAKRLINLGGVEKVYYGEEYRIKDSLTLLESVGISIEQLPLTAKDSDSKGPCCP